ncbi:MAG: DUF616 domain-containing protein [Caulobacteraceae bacterium]|nr:DUF616 domain-containing protein [Caulobacteraceae bacterium]
MITVYTSLVGDRDECLPNQVPEGVHFEFFRDCYDKFKDDRRNSRPHKILAHQYINSEYSIYMDANIRLLVNPQYLIDKYLSDCDLAVWKHPSRDCLYDEALACCKMKLDNVETIIEQVKKYEDEGFPKHKGLGECNVIFRRHTPKVEEFNNAWWSEYTRHSRRDQISFPYAADKVGIEYKLIPDFFIIDPNDPTKATKESGDFEIVAHTKNK